MSADTPPMANTPAARPAGMRCAVEANLQASADGICTL